MRRTAPLLLLGFLACTGTGVSPNRQAAKAIDPTAAPFVTPARWEFHPAAPDTPTAAVRLDDGRCLLTAAGGQRWLVTPEAGAPPAKPGVRGRLACAGKAAASSALAAEELVGVFKSKTSAGYLFLGASGTVFEADEPLGPFQRTERPKAPLGRVATSGTHVLGVALDGSIHRWEEGKGFRKVAAPPGKVFDIAVDGAGHALALGFPESLFTSRDGGSSWSPVKTKPIGARRVGLTDKGELAAEGLFESVFFREGSAPAPAKGTSVTAPVSLDLALDLAPSASAALAGRAALDGDRYVELARNGDEDWTLWRGKLDTKLERIPLPGTKACELFRVGLRGTIVVTACLGKQGERTSARVRKSSDFGTTFSEPFELGMAELDSSVMAEAEAASIAVSSGGRALLAGFCIGKDASACKPQAPVLLRTEGRSLRATVAGAPPLGARASLPAFSSDGRSAYFLAKRGKDERLTLFVSHDAGETFSERVLAASSTKRSEGPRGDEDSDEEPAHDTSNDAELELDDSGIASIRSGDDGVVGITLLRGREWVHLLVDEDGRVLQTGSPPNEEAVLTGFGRRLIAVGNSASADASNPDGVALWESSDGGLSWEEEAAPLALTRTWERASPMTCSAYGCLVGATLTRVGWGGSPAGQGSERSSDPEGANKPKVRTPIACELSPSTRWTRIDQVHGKNLFPSIREAMRGRSAWSVVTEDVATGAIVTHSAMLSDRGPDSKDTEARIAAKPLLATTGKVNQTAGILSHQIEGYFAVRAPFPADAKGDLKVGAPMKNLELAWENYLDGTSGRATIADAGVYDREDVQGSAHTVLRTLRPSLITVSVRSVYLRPHHLGSKNQTVFFIDQGGREQRFTFPKFEAKGPFGPLDINVDAVTIDGQPFGVGLVRDRAPVSWTNTVLTAKRNGSNKTPAPWDITATSIAPSRIDLLYLTHTDWTYRGQSTIGLSSLVVDPRTNRGWAYFDAFRADGTALPPEPVPTLTDVGDKPRACSSAERKASARIEAFSVHEGQVYFEGTRHPVLVVETGGKAASMAQGVSTVLLTSAAVLHGTPENACVAAYEGSPLRDGGGGFTAILSGDLAHSWLFRKADAPAAGRRPGAGPSFEARPMTCRFDPGAKVPENVWNEPGTTLSER